jgi:hypothetical protein
MGVHILVFDNSIVQQSIKNLKCFKEVFCSLLFYKNLVLCVLFVTLAQYSQRAFIFKLDHKYQQLEFEPTESRILLYTVETWQNLNNECLLKFSFCVNKKYCVQQCKILREYQ